MNLDRLQNLAQNFFDNFNNFALHLVYAKSLEKELDSLEKELIKERHNKYLKRIIIVLHDVMRINPVAKMKVEQAEVILNVIKKISPSKKLKRKEFLRMCKDIRDAGLFILPVTPEVRKTAEEVFGKDKK